EREFFKDLKAYMLGHALRSRAWLEHEFYRLPFEPWSPVRGQIHQLVRAVNVRRSVAGYEPVSKSCVRLRRRSVRPFAVIEPETAEGATVRDSLQLSATVETNSPSTGGVFLMSSVGFRSR